MRNVLITGGSGFVGKKLSVLLQKNGFNIVWLSRTPKSNNLFKTYLWDTDKGFIDAAAFENLAGIIHLAGTNIGEGLWTRKRKQSIINSRVNSSKLLYSELSKRKLKLDFFVSTSAIGFYGSSFTKEFNEDSPLGNDFMAEVCDLWEMSVEPIKKLTYNFSIVRVGIVLDKKEGALSKMLLPLKFGVGSKFGNGKMFYSWIHHEDLCNIYIHVIKNKLNGTYNAVAPNPITQKELNNSIIKTKNQFAITFPAPSLFLKTILGEQSAIVLNSTNVSADKIKMSGYKFKYPDISKALENLL